jgi:hypothetical protein
MSRERLLSRLLRGFAMKKILFLLVAAAAIYFAWMRFAPRPSSSAPRAPSGDGRAANAQQRIDALSGAAPAE